MEDYWEGGSGGQNGDCRGGNDRGSDMDDAGGNACVMKLGKIIITDFGGDCLQS